MKGNIDLTPTEAEMVKWVRKIIDEKDEKMLALKGYYKVILCGDCVHFTKGMAIGMCKRDPEKPIFPMGWDNFCKYGERREENAVD